MFNFNKTNFKAEFNNNWIGRINKTTYMNH